MKNQTIEEAASARTQVAKHSPLAQMKDKLFFASIVLVCIIVGIITVWPKTHAKMLHETQEKEEITSTLKQNMAYIAALKARNTEVKSSGYHGSNPNYPPPLKPIPVKSQVSKEILARMNAPSTFFTISREEGVSVKANGKTLTGRDSNAEFLNNQDDITSVSAKHLPHPSLTVPAGEMIPATMETAINSELAGMARAITARDVYSLSGSKLLIPKGSTLVGQFNSNVTQAQSRIFVVWNRLQLPNGVIITLNSPGSDTVGRAGLTADSIDRHFIERFGTGALLSVLGAYSAAAGVNGQDEYNSLAQYRMNLSQSFQQAANHTLQQDMQTRPTLQINQGTQINVFVAHDLDFYRVGAS